jgi:hypothetical protein
MLLSQRISPSITVPSTILLIAFSEDDSEGLADVFPFDNIVQ